MADVDAINDRLNGLVNLLNVVGIDGVDPDALVEEQKKIKSDKGGSTSTPSTQSSDTQILEIIRKLQQAQADSPEILAALKSPELRALASLAATKQAKPEPKKAAPSLEDVMDDDDNYPKIGPGYSDDISVVSDLSTPTVMTKQNIAEEEYYKDVSGGPGALPPMHIGLGAGQRPPGAAAGPGGGQYVPKTKNRVSQVNAGATRRAIAKSGGAAAQRRLNYQQAMAKLQSNEYGKPVAAKGDQSYMANFSPKKKTAAFFPTSPTLSNPKLPDELPSLADQGKKGKQTRNKAAVKEKKGKKTALAGQEVTDFELDSDPAAPKFDRVPSPPAPAPTKKKKEKPAPVIQDIDWGRTGGSGSSAWPAFGGAKPEKNADVFVDNDGFFSSDAFGGGSDPFASSKSPKSKKDSAGKARKSRKDGDSKEKKKKSKSKRASLAM